jgi:Integrase core domain.
LSVFGQRRNIRRHTARRTTFADWDDVKVGFLEADLVAHCGSSTAGKFLNTLVMTDIRTGWVEPFCLLGKRHEDVLAALHEMKQVLPFQLLGFDTDNGSEFINEALLDYCEEEHITFTRGRENKKNDQCYVEEKNGSVVRRVVGYHRYEGAIAKDAFNRLYGVLRLYVNFFQPSMKLLSKERIGGKVRKNTILHVLLIGVYSNLQIFQSSRGS